jgi:hypothetical protein
MFIISAFPHLDWLFDWFRILNPSRQDRRDPQGDCTTRITETTHLRMLECIAYRDNHQAATFVMVTKSIVI